MDDIGILLYGYGDKAAHDISAALTAALGSEPILISGSGREDDALIEVLENPMPVVFTDGPFKFMVMLGVDEDQMRAVMKALPPGGVVPRPVFSVLTEQNVNWKISTLKEHLAEEDRVWREKREKKE